VRRGSRRVRLSNGNLLVEPVRVVGRPRGRRPLPSEPVLPSAFADMKPPEANAGLPIKVRLVWAAIIVGMVVGLQWKFDVAQYLEPSRLGPAMIAVREWAASIGAWQFSVLIAGGALALLLNVPPLFIVATNVVVFGWLVGALVTAASLTGGLSLVFLAAHWFGRPMLHRFFARALAGLERYLGARKLPEVIAIRLAFHLNPLVNWALAISNISFRTFMLGTLIGAGPMVALQIWLTAMVSDIASSGATVDPTSMPQMYIRLVLVLSLIVALRFWRPRRPRRPD
jgi:uncharacterized membrane protein YdjX (TVP38/TMEM64 family)